MSGGARAPKAAVTTQSLGKDRLTRGLANSLRQQTGSVDNGVNTAVQAITGSAGARGLADPSIDTLQRTVQGEFLSPEFLSGQIEAASAPALREFRRSIAPSIAGRFAAAGRSGSGAEAGAFEDASDLVARNISESAARLIGQERDRQQQAAGFFPQIQAADQQRAIAQLNTEQTPLNRLLGIAGAVPGLRTSTSVGGTPANPGKGGALGSVAGGIGGALIGGPAGGALGANLGATAGSVF